MRGAGLGSADVRLTWLSHNLEGPVHNDRPGMVQNWRYSREKQRKNTQKIGKKRVFDVDFMHFLASRRGAAARRSKPREFSRDRTNAGRSVQYPPAPA